MKDNCKRNEISFILQDKHNNTKTYKKGCYCFKSSITHLCFFYSELEDVWVTVLLNGWIKVNGKKVEGEAIPLVANIYSIEIDGEPYHFYSHTSQAKAASKVVTEFISNADEKKLWKEDIFYYFKSLRNIDDCESYLEILMENPVFERDSHGMIKLNYFMYGLVRYYNLRNLLLAEFKYYMRVGRTFNIIEFKSFHEDLEHYNYISRNKVHSREGSFSISEYLYNLVGCYYLERLMHPENELFEISRVWIAHYNLGPVSGIRNTCKREVDVVEDYNIKKSCKSDDGSEEKLGQFCRKLVCREVKLLRACFTEVEPTKKKDRTQKKRSTSLVEDNGSINDKVWMLTRRPNEF